MLQQDTAEDFVIGTGETHAVREFCEAAFGAMDLDYQKFVVQDPQFYRPAEVDLLVSDPAKAKKMLSWQPKVSFEELVTMMVQADLNSLRREVS
jgi:GDPmannose 4,6-dehydratase